MSTNMNSGDEEPPSLVQCRVCGSMIDINNKKEQHVVKCEYCNEATVSKPPSQQIFLTPLVEYWRNNLTRCLSFETYPTITSAD